MQRVVIGSLFILLVCTLHSAWAIDRTFMIVWQNNAENIPGTSMEVSRFFVGYRLNDPVKANGDPDYEMRIVEVDNAADTFFHDEVSLTGLIEADKFAVAVAACNQAGYCSAWTPEAVHIVVADPLPGEGDERPQTPLVVQIIIQ